MTITDAALKAAVRLSARYINDRFLPDKAIDVVDEGGLKTRLTVYVGRRASKTLEEDIRSSRKRKRTRSAARHTPSSPVRSRRNRLRREKIRKMKEKWESEKGEQAADCGRERHCGCDLRMDKDPGEQARRGEQNVS